MANQLRKAIPVATSNVLQWFTAHFRRSLPMRTVMPADAQAAANVRVDVICTNIATSIKVEVKVDSIGGIGKESDKEISIWHPKCLKLHYAYTHKHKKKFLLKTREKVTEKFFTNGLQKPCTWLIVNSQHEKSFSLRSKYYYAK